jgi:hypothetical protein
VSDHVRSSEVKPDDVVHQAEQVRRHHAHHPRVGRRLRVRRPAWQQIR